jgi:hypothetical protein
VRRSVCANQVGVMDLPPHPHRCCSASAHIHTHEFSCPVLFTPPPILCGSNKPHFLILNLGATAAVCGLRHRPSSAGRHVSNPHYPSLPNSWTMDVIDGPQNKTSEMLKNIFL